jgi:hypothetical protein
MRDERVGKFAWGQQKYGVGPSRTPFSNTQQHQSLGLTIPHLSERTATLTDAASRLS